MLACRLRRLTTINPLVRGYATALRQRKCKCPLPYLPRSSLRYYRKWYQREDTRPQPRRRAGWRRDDSHKLEANQRTSSSPITPVGESSCLTVLYQADPSILTTGYQVL